MEKIPNVVNVTTLPKDMTNIITHDTTLGATVIVDDVSDTEEVPRRNNLMLISPNKKFHIFQKRKVPNSIIGVRSNK